MNPIKLTLTKSGDDEWDWWIIERAEHDGRTWMKDTGPNSLSLRCSSRFSDADVEGTAGEMREIARAIRSRGSFSATRCSVRVDGPRAIFCSPRNSREDGVTDLACADELATQIETTLALGTPEQKEQDAYGRWRRGSRSQDATREAAFRAGCVCHFLEGDFHHGIGCPEFKLKSP